jgi:hypothetical protein
MSDIVERLRVCGGYKSIALIGGELMVFNEAADEIERLRAQVDALAKLLQPNPEQQAQAAVGREIWEARQ